MRAATLPELSVKRWHWWRLRVGLFSGLFSGLLLAGTVPAMVHEDRLDFPSGEICLLYTSPSPRDGHQSRMPSSA